MKSTDLATENKRETLQILASLPGQAADSKQAKESKILKYRALIFEKQMNGTFEIIF